MSQPSQTSEIVHIPPRPTGNTTRRRRRRPRKRNARMRGRPLKTSSSNVVSQTTAPVSVPSPGPSPDAQIDSGRSRLPKKTIAPYLTKDGQAYYSKVFPGFEYSFIGAAVKHEHICSAHARKIGEAAAVKRLAGCYSVDHPIIDVGFGARLINNKNVHGCECGTDPYTLDKLVRYSRRYPNAILEGNALRPNGKWTYCKCNFSNCPHVPNAGSLLFVHSIYYNTPRDVVTMLLKTRYRTAVSIHHIFDKNSGGFYCYDGKYESRYKIIGKVRTNCGADDRVVMQVIGNEHTYAHSRCSWLMEPESYTNVYLNGTNYLLTWTKFAVENVGHTVGYQFNVHVVPKPVKPSVYPKFDFTTTAEPVKVNDELLTRAFNLRAKDCVQHISKGSNSINLKLRKQPALVVPMKMISDLRRWYAGKPVNAKTWATLTAEARRIAKPKYYPDCELNSYALAQAVLPLCVYIVGETTRDFKAVEKFFCKSNLKHITEYNDMLSFETWRHPLWLRILLACITPTGIFLLLCIIALCLWFLLENGEELSYMAADYFGRQLLEFDEPESHFMQAKRWFATEIYELVRDSIAVTMCLSGLVVLTTIIHWLIQWMLRRSDRTCKYSGWNAFRDSVVSERRCLTVSSAIPVGAGFPGFESKLDLRPFERDPTAKLKILSVCNRRPEHQVVTAVGVCFCTAAPMVHTSSQANLIKGIISRVIHKPIYDPDPKAWQLLDKLMRNELPLDGSSGTPRSVKPNFTFCNKVINQHPPYSFEEYLLRYPPNKRKVLLKYADRVNSGDIANRQIVYNCFIKREKLMVITKDEHVEKKPRVIQGGPQLEKITSGVWFLDYAYAMKHEWNISNWIWFSSGATTDDYNMWFNCALDRLGGVDNLVFIGSDFSTYDVTQGRICIKRECDWYKELGILQHVQGARQILKTKMKTTVYGKGIKVQYWAHRKSGTNDTTTGNSKNTAEVVGGHAKHFGYDHAVMITVQGDDNYTLVRADVLKRIFPTHEAYEQSLVDWSKALGFKLKVQMSRCPTDVEFVSCRFFPIANYKYAIGKKPGRVLVKLGYMMTKPGRSRKQWLALLKGTCLSYLPTGNHVPFLRVYLQKMVNYIKVNPKFDDKCQFRMGGCPQVANRDTFCYFEHTYGIGLTEERMFARHIDEAISKHGLPCIIDSPYVDEMFRIDNLM